MEITLKIGSSLLIFFDLQAPKNKISKTMKYILGFDIEKNVCPFEKSDMEPILMGSPFKSKEYLLLNDKIIFCYNDLLFYESDKCH